MAWLKGIRGITLWTDDMRKWAWLYTDVFCGKPIMHIRTQAGTRSYKVQFPHFQVLLIQINQNLFDEARFIKRHGDGMVHHPTFWVRNKKDFGNHIRRQKNVELQGNTFSFGDLQFTITDEELPSVPLRKARLVGIDHITYVVEPHLIKEYIWCCTEVLGGRPGLAVDDTNPEDPASMMLYTVDFEEVDGYPGFGIAFVAPVSHSAKETPHTARYLERHGTCTIQHVAFQARKPLARFFDHLERFGGHFQGETFVLKDPRGYVKQRFSAGVHAEENPACTSFYEFLDRLRRKDFPGFTREAGKFLHRQAQEAMLEDRRDTLVNFSLLPDSWRLPIVRRVS